MEADAIEQSKQDTLKHRAEVIKQMDKILSKAKLRGKTHDESKLHSPELEIFAEHSPKLANTTYGADEYFTQLKEMKPALDHHYAVNRHHTLHHDQGIRDFNIVDLIEFACDIKAASLRQNDGNVLTSLKSMQERFGYSDDLAAIIKNTMIFLDLE